MSTLDDWNDWMRFFERLTRAGLEAGPLTDDEVHAMVAALRQPPASIEIPPYFLPCRPASSGFTQYPLAAADRFRKQLAAAGFTAAELRTFSDASADAMVLALARMRSDRARIPPATWNDWDYLALADGGVLMAAERTPTRAKEMARHRGCSDPRVLPATHLKRSEIKLAVPPEDRTPC